MALQVGRTLRRVDEAPATRSILTCVVVCAVGRSGEGAPKGAAQSPVAAQSAADRSRRARGRGGWSAVIGELRALSA